ncbi:MAG: hypothetical protein P1U58_03335 [Verrucomicrobiales bacterium]|nr:hypothetical protein [Verrucomicrobiales bacterium]
MKSFRRWFSIATCCSLWLSAGETARAQESLSDLPSFRDGCRALADARYKTAADHLRQVWERLEIEGAGEVEKEFVTTRLFEAWVKNGDTDHVVEWLDTNPSLDPSPARLRWTALALQEQLRFSDAAEAYSLLRGLPGASEETTGLDHAFCLAMSGDAAGANEQMQLVAPITTPAEHLQAALVAGKTSNHEAALNWLEGIEEAVDSVVKLNLQSWNLIQLGRSTEAFDKILTAIEEETVNEIRLRKFLLLEQAEKTSPAIAPRETLRAWASGEDSHLAEGASFFLAITGSDQEQLPVQLTEWLEQHNESIYAEEVRFRTGKWEEGPRDTNSTPPSFTGIPEFSVHAQFALASADYREGLFESAVQRFVDLSELGNPENRHRSLYNAALASLKAEDFESFRLHEGNLKKLIPNSGRVANLTYLAGLFRAARAESDALAFLQTFIRNNPSHPRRVEAQLALAEIHLNQAPARPQAARQIFEALRTQALTLVQNERLDYTGVWLELIDNNVSNFTERAEVFLREWPGSNYFPEVAMLLARSYFAENRLEEANLLFNRVAKDFPESPFADLAPLFAAKSSAPGDSAILAWKTIAYGSGPYAIEGQHGLGLLFLKLDRFNEAREVFSEVQREATPGSELHFAAIADTGYAYYLEALAAGQDEKLLLQAAGTFSDLSEMPEASTYWHYSATLRKARCLEGIGNKEVALELYRSIVESSSDSESGFSTDEDLRTREWVFRAGFFAIRILEENEDWRAAIKMADSLSRKNGPRAIEASNLAEQMRLKHWVWD